MDATNLPGLHLVAAGITAISRDHEDILGSSLAAIAGEKAAIIRKSKGQDIKAACGQLRGSQTALPA